MNKFFTLLLILVLSSFLSNAKSNQKEFFSAQIETVKSLKAIVNSVTPKTIEKQQLKSAVASKKMLDKISYPDGSYKLFSYNEQGLLVDYKNYIFDSFDDKVILQEQQQFEYDANGNQTLFIDRNNDTFDGFVVISKVETSYQDNNMPKEEIEWEFSESDKVLEKISKTVYIVVDAKNVTTESYGFDKDKSDWVLSQKSEINFDKFTQPNSIKSYGYNAKTETYEPQGILEFTYNNKGLETQSVAKAISEDSGEMMVGLTTTSTYDDAGNLLHEVASGTYMGMPLVAYENIYTYENGLMISDEYKSMFGETKTEYSYSNGKLSEKRDFYPDFDDDGISKGLILQYKDQFSFDNSIAVADLVYPSELDKYFHAYNDFCEPFYFDFGAISSTICFSWDYRTEAVIEKYRGEYHYSNFKAGVSEEPSANKFIELNMNFSPNPFNDILNVDTQENSLVVSVYNTVGQLIYNSTIKGQTSINTSNWEKGVYLICTQSDNAVNSMKLIKQ